MKTRNKRIAGLAAVGMIVGGGVAGAFAATQGQDDQAANLAAALSHRTGEQVSAADVKGAFTDVLKERLAKGVASGRITQAQADQMLKRAADAPLPGMGGPGGMGGHHRKGQDAVGAAVAKRLGMTGEQLHQARGQGKTLAQVAESKGVSRADIIRTVTEALSSSPRGASLTDPQRQTVATRIVDGTGGPRGAQHAGPGAGQHRGPGGGQHRGPGGGVIRDALVKALGIDEQALRTARAAGKTPAQVAGEKGVEVSTVVNAVVAAMKAQGPPPGAPAKSDAEMTEVATDIVNGKGPGGRHHGGPGGALPPPGP